MGSSGEREGRFSRDPLPVFSAEAIVSCSGIDVVHLAFPLSSTASPTFQGALKGGFGETVVACDMPERCKFLWTHKEVDPAPQPVVGPVLQVGDTEKFPPALGFKSLDSFFRVGKQGACFTTVDEDVGDKRLAELELVCKAEGVAPPDPVYSGNCCHC